MVTITIPNWLIGVGIAMWMISTGLKIVIWRLNRRIAQATKK